MVPSKVIHIRDARRRVIKAKKKRGAADKLSLAQRISTWMSSGTTKGSVLLAGLLGGLVMGALVAAVLSAPGHQASMDAPTAINDQQLP